MKPATSGARYIYQTTWILYYTSELKNNNGSIALGTRRPRIKIADELSKLLVPNNQSRS